MRALLAFAALALGSLPGAGSGCVQARASACSSTGRRIPAAIAHDRSRAHAPPATRICPTPITSRSAIARSPRDTTVDGPIAVAHGNLDVYGTVNGDVVALDGNMRVHKGARVTGDAWAAGGQRHHRRRRGRRHEARDRRRRSGRCPRRAARSRSALGSRSSSSIGWFALLAIIGLGVMVFAEGNLDGVVIALERGFARSFWIGLAGQVDRAARAARARRRTGDHGDRRAADSVRDRRLRHRRGGLGHARLSRRRASHRRRAGVGRAERRRRAACICAR